MENAKRTPLVQCMRQRPEIFTDRLAAKDSRSGIYLLFREILDNAIDEIRSCLQNDRNCFDDKAFHIEVSVEANRIKVRDCGRGLSYCRALSACTEQGDKKSNDFSQKNKNGDFQYSIGLNEMGLKFVSALSSHLVFRSFSDRSYCELVFEKGELTSSLDILQSTAEYGTEVEFEPDSKYFAHPADLFVMGEIVREYAALNTNVRLSFNGEAVKMSDGVMDLLKHRLGLSGGKLCCAEHYVADENFIQKCREARYMEYASCLSDTKGFVCVFVNGAGTECTKGVCIAHLIEKLTEHYIRKTDGDGNSIQERLCVMASVRISDPHFLDYGKTELANTAVAGDLDDFLEEN